MSERPRPWMPWLIAVIALLTLVLAAWGFRSHNELVSCYLKAARLYVIGSDMYVMPADGVGRWMYPPAMIIPVAPLVFVPEVVARIAWVALLVGALLVSAWMLVRALLPPTLDEHERRLRAIALIAAVIFSQKHLISPFSYLAHDGLIALCVVAGFYAGAKRRDGWAGFAFGLGAALKVTPGLFLPMLLLQRRWRAATSMVATVLVVSVLPDLVTVAQGQRPQLIRFVDIALHASDVTRAGGGHWESFNVLAHNLSAMISRWTTPTPPAFQEEFGGDYALVHLDEATRRIVTGAALALVLAAVCAVAILSQRAIRRGGDLVLVRLNDVAATACGMVLLPPHSSKYHFSIVFLAAASTFIFVLARRRDPLVVACAILLLVLGLPTGSDLIGNRAADLVLLYGSVGLFALVALVACTRIVWCERNGAQACRVVPVSAVPTSRDGQH